MTDVLSKLPELMWIHPSQNITFVLPVTERNAGFRHEDARYAFNFRENDTIEGLGAKNVTFSYVIPFRQDIAKGPFKNLFTEVYPSFLFTCRSPLPGRLIDPFLGEYRCKVTTYEELVDVNRRDGLDVRVDFIHTPEDSEEFIFAPAVTLDDVVSQAGALDAAVQGIDPATWANRQLPPPKPLVNPLRALKGVLDQVNAAGNRVVSAIHGLAMQVEDLERSAERLADPKISPQIISASRRLSIALIDLEKTTARPDRIVGRYVTSVASTLLELVKITGMTVEELIQLNPLLPKRNIVPPGFGLNVFTDGENRYRNG